MGMVTHKIVGLKENMIQNIDGGPQLLKNGCMWYIIENIIDMHMLHPI
jgi:hypothetical protein